ncbi:MAG: SPFH domain-containing protein [Clostridia bacterium]|nr:SPFH domain-containing protein [Clostridia bacterium]
MAIINVIKYEGDNSTFVFKHPVEDFNTGTQLIVHESQEAIFFRDGKLLDRFGSGKYTLDTESLPLMKKFFKKVAEGPSQFHAEVYFVNLTTMMGIKWGTDSKIRMFDPASGLHVELGASGDFNLRVSDSGKILLKLVGTELGLKRDEILGGNGYSNSAVSGKFKGLVMNKVKSLLPKSIRENNINILEVDEYLSDISEYIKDELNIVFNSYGLCLPEFFVTNIATPDDDPNYKRLKQQHAERYLKIQEERIRKAEAEERRGRVIVEAETAAEVKLVGVKAEEEATRRMAYAEAEKKRAEGLAEADVMRAKGFTYQQETQREIGVAIAQNEGGASGGAGSAISGVVQAGVGIGAAVAVGKATVGAVSGVMDDVMGSSQQTNSVNVITWKCPKCGYDRNTGKFCSECGEKKVEISIKWICPNCGHENTGKFCGECGTKKE